MLVNLVLTIALSLLVACGSNNNGDGTKQSNTFGSILNLNATLSDPQKEDLTTICGALTLRAEKLLLKIGEADDFSFSSQTCGAAIASRNLSALIESPATDIFLYSPTSFESKFVKTIPTHKSSVFSSACAKDTDSNYKLPSVIKQSDTINIAVEIAQTTATTKNLAFKYYQKLATGNFQLYMTERFVINTSRTAAQIDEIGSVSDYRKETPCKTNSTLVDFISQTRR